MKVKQLNIFLSIPKCFCLIELQMWAGEVDDKSRLNLGVQFPVKCQYCKWDYIITSHVKARWFSRTILFYSTFDIDSTFISPYYLFLEHIAFWQYITFLHYIMMLPYYPFLHYIAQKNIDHVNLSNSHTKRKHLKPNGMLNFDTSSNLDCDFVFKIQFEYSSIPVLHDKCCCWW